MGSVSPPYFPARDSPSILEPSESPPRVPDPPEPTDSETYTQRDEELLADDNSNSIDGVYPSPSTYTFDPEDSNSSLTTLVQWPGPAHSYDSNVTQPPSPFRTNESSNFSVMTVTEESNSLNSLPDAIIRRYEEGTGTITLRQHVDTERVPTPEIEETRHSNKSEEINEPPAKIRKVETPKPPNDDLDGETCPICLDSWATSGDHRLVALKCGHLFGAQCVERWLKAQTAKERSCPTCKSKANLRDIRFIYAKRLVAVDTSEVTAMQKQLEKLQTEKGKVELELHKSKIAHRACAQQLESLRNTMMKSENRPQVKKTWRFALEKNIEICKDGGCRVLTYNCRTYELYVSQKSTNSLFPGYGIRKVSCVDYKQGQFVHLHPKPIRDISYSQPKDLLLSVGLDSSARIVERGIPSTTVQAGVQLWSCSWDYLRSNEFYVGGVGGFIQQYDVRNPSNYIQRLSAPGDMSPVVSLCSTEYGLLSCHLNSCWLWVANSSGQWEPRGLPIEGPFMSLCYDNESHRALVSCRPSANSNERSRLTLCQFKSDVSNGEVTCNVDHTFQGSARSSLMSRAAWVKAPGASWVAGHSESDAALLLHGLDGARTMSLPAAEPALDVCSVSLNGDTILAALSESRLRLYKAVPTNS